MQVGDLVIDRHSEKMHIILRTTRMFAFLSGCPSNRAFRKIDLEMLSENKKNNNMGAVS